MHGRKGEKKKKKGLMFFQLNIYETKHVSVSMIVYPYFGTNYYNSIAIIPAYSDLAIRKR